MRLLVGAVVAMLAGCAGSGGASLVVGTTTTTQETGLVDVLLPAFERDTGLRARAVVGGSGEILEKARRGDVDVLLTHAPRQEEAMLAEGMIARREPVMHNLFAVAGPEEDPAGVAGAEDAADALARILASDALFVSRGDRSGTHEKELEIWARAGLDPATFDRARYKETGAGQGQTLLVASEKGAYLLVDQGTLSRFHAEGRAERIVDLFHDDPVLRNEYSVSLLNATRLPSLRHADARTFAEWLTSAPGRTVIAAYAPEGARLFTPEDG